MSTSVIFALDSAQIESQRLTTEKGRKIFFTFSLAILKNLFHIHPCPQISGQLNNKLKTN